MGLPPCRSCGSADCVSILDLGALTMPTIVPNVSLDDVALPGSAAGDKLAFLMYPQAESAQGRYDALDPDNFKYTITAREIA